MTVWNVAKHELHNIFRLLGHHSSVDSSPATILQSRVRIINEKEAVFLKYFWICHKSTKGQFSLHLLLLKSSMPMPTYDASKHVLHNILGFVTKAQQLTTWANSAFISFYERAPCPCLPMMMTSMCCKIFLDLSQKHKRPIQPSSPSTKELHAHA